MARLKSTTIDLPSLGSQNQCIFTVSTETSEKRRIKNQIAVSRNGFWAVIKGQASVHNHL